MPGLFSVPGTKNAADTLATLWELLTAERRCPSCHSAFSVSRLNKAGAGPEASRHFCPSCAANLKPREQGYCPLCGEPAEWESQSPAPCGGCLTKRPRWAETTFYGTHQGLLRELLLRLKFQQDLSLAHSLGSLLAAHPGLLCIKADMAVPVPLHGGRLAGRGFNQSLELARPLAKRLGIPLDAACLVRMRATDPQRGLSRENRRRNIHAAFTAGQAVRERHILLVDDIMTTGATLEAAASALLDAGAASVHVAVISRTPSFR